MTFHVKQGWAERADRGAGVFHVKQQGTRNWEFHVKLAGSGFLCELGVRPARVFVQPAESRS